VTGPYATEDDAQRRVNALRQHGTWPGTVRHPDGTYSLTYDPGFTVRGL
jgi:hypothetical protein